MGLANRIRRRALHGRQAGYREGQRQGRDRSDRWRKHLLHAVLAELQRSRRQQVDLLRLRLCRPHADRLFLSANFSGRACPINKTDYSNANYTKALNAQFATVCANAKAAKVLLLTVALDLDPKNSAEKTQIDALESCASDSRFRKGADGKPAKLFWNARAETWPTRSRKSPTNCRTCASSEDQAVGPDRGSSRTDPGRKIATPRQVWQQADTVPR